MRFVTFALAILTVAGAIAALMIVAAGDWLLATRGGELFLIGLGVAMMAEIGSDLLRWWVDRMRTTAAGGAIALAVLSGIIPLLLLIGFDLAVLDMLAGTGSAHPAAMRWLFAYAVATLPYTVFAGRVPGRLRTLSGIHAYAGHLIFIVLSGVVLGDIRWPIAIIALVPLTLPPAIVATLVALSGRRTMASIRM